MSTVISNVFSINGVVDTNRSVLENMNEIATSAGAWVTFDSNQGKWAVVINQTGSSVKSFNDSNIIGSINISSTGLTEMYNGVEVEFPHKDLNDEPDYIKFSVAAGARYPNEPDNVLSMNLTLVNNPIQAQLLAARELKQSRVDKVIEFRTDFSSLGLQAGQLISITNTAYGYTSKVFRIIKIQEDDEQDGVFTLSITALEYDADVYSTAGLLREERNRNTGILNKSINTAVKTVDQQANLPLDLSNVAKSLGLILTFNSLTGRWELSQGGQQANIAGTNAVITWTFDTGTDLDIRCRLLNPGVGQNFLDDYLGYTGASSVSAWPIAGTAYLVWGGDNTGTGSEAVAVNIAAIKSAYPAQQYIIIECRGNWYAAVGTTPVKLTAKIFENGSIVGPSSFTFTNPTATKTRLIEGLSVFVDSFHGASIEADGFNGDTALGDLMGYFVFDTVNDIAQFRNDLTGIM